MLKTTALKQNYYRTPLAHWLSTVTMCWCQGQQYGLHSVFFLIFYNLQLSNSERSPYRYWEGMLLSFHGDQMGMVSVYYSNDI